MSERFAGLRRTQVLAPFSSLVLAQVAGSGLGFVFWVLAARYLATGTVGVSSAAVTSQTLVGSLAMLGLGTLLIGEVKALDPARQRHLLTSALGVAGAAGVVLGATVVLLSPLLSSSLQVAFSDSLLATLFVVGVATTGVGLVLDQSVLGLGRSRLQVWRNLIASGLRFPIAALLLWLGVRSASVVVFSWVASLVVSVAVVWLLLGLPRAPRVPGEGSLDLVRRHWRPALHQHALNQSLSAGPMLVPVVAAVVLAPVPNAEFAMAWLMATFVFIPPYMLATALFAVSVKRSVAEFRASARHTLPAALLLSLSLCAAAWLLGPFVLGILGAHYADHSAPVLSVLVLGGLWMVVKDHLVAYARVTDQFSRATALAAGCVALELVGALAGGVVGGPLGVAVGWLSMVAVEAAVGVPLAWRVLRVQEHGSGTTGERTR